MDNIQQIAYEAGYTDEFIDKLEDALNDAAFVATLKELNDPDAVRAHFAQKDLTLADETIQALIETRDNPLESADLNEDDLEAVVGGKKKMKFSDRFWGSLGIGLLAGAYSSNPAVGIAVGVGVFIGSYIIGA